MNYFYFIVMAFSLDSLLKINLGGVNVQVGVMLSLVFSFMFLARGIRIVEFIGQNRYLMILALYCFVSGFFARDIYVFIQVFLYFFVAILVYYCMFICVMHSGSNYLERLASVSIVCVVLGGGAQYFLYYLYDYQLVLGGIDSSYYKSGGSIEYRLRGFFFEPNWFSLFLFYSVAAALLVNSRFFIANYSRVFLFVLIIIAFSLSDTRVVSLFFALIMVSLFIVRIKFMSRATVLYATAFGFLCMLAYNFGDQFTSFEYLVEEDRSLSARVFTIFNSFDFLVDEHSLFDLIVGLGFSNWGYYSNTYLLSAFNYLGEQSAVQRDTAELQVFLLEVGIVSISLVFFDFVSFIIKILKSNFSRSEKSVAALIMLSLPVFGLFYPIYTFMMTLPFYFVARSIIIRKVISND